MSWLDRTARVQKAATRVFGEENVFLDFHGIGLSTEPIPSIFREAHEAVRIDLEAEISSESPLLDVRLADLPREPNPPEPRSQSDYVVVRGERLRIVDSREDGEGMLTLVLREVE